MTLWNQWRMDVAGLAIILGLTGLTYFGQISPILRRNELAKVQAAELIEQQKRSRDLERTVRTTTDQLDASRQTFSKNMLKLEPVSELNNRLAKLTELASEYGLVVDSIEAGESSDVERYSMTSIRLTGRGTYRNCQSALRNLRESMPDIGIVTMQMTSGGVNIDTNASFVFDLVWHTQLRARITKK